MTQIQINSFISSINATKSHLKELARKFNNPTNWQTISNVNTLDLAEYLRKGYSIRGGVKSGGNLLENIESVSWLFLDFDHSTLAESKQAPIFKYAALYYYTPSYQPGINEKHRLVFKLDRPVSASEYKLLYTFIITNFYPYADNLTDAGRLFFGACNPDHVVVINEHTALPVDNFLSCIGDDTSDISDNTVLADRISKAIDDRISKAALPDDQIIKPRYAALKHICKEIWMNICDLSDIDALYCLDRHNFEKQPSGQNIAKWHGHRPEDKEKDNGSGFLIVWNNEELPPTWQNQATGEKGNIVDYWAKYSGKVYDSIKWEDDPDCENFATIINDICNHFNVDSFDISEIVRKKKKQSKERKYQNLKEILDNFTYMIKSGAKDVYVYYDFTSGTWLFKPDAQQVWRDCVKPYMMMKNDTQEDLESNKTATYYIGLIRNYAGYRSIEKINFDEKIDFDFIPMANGDYNWKSKEFIPGFNPALHNQHRYKYTYNAEAGINSKGAKILNEWLTWTYKDTPTKQAVLDWLALNVAGLAGETNKILCFWGQPGSGKSVILNLLNNLLDQLAAPIDSKKLGLSDNRFIFQSADGKYATTIDEFRTNQIGWDNLKQLAGTYKPIIDVEKKGLTSYKSIYRGSVTTASQDTFSLPPYHDGGIRRRIVTIQHTEEMINPIYADIDYRLAQSEILNDIFNWLITLDMDAALKRFKEYAKSAEVKETIMKVMIESDTVLQFMKEKIVFTNNPNDRVSNLEIQVAYRRFLIEDLYQPIDSRDDHKIAKVTQYIREKASIKDNGFDWKLCPRKGQDAKIIIDGKRMRGLKGLRIVNNNSSDFDSLI